VKRQQAPLLRLNQEIFMKLSVDRRPGGFTLIELLVVILIIAILAALLLPVLAGAKRHAVNTQCLNNEKQQCVALFMYADDNLDTLPDGSSGKWAWDMNAGLANLLIASGTTPKTWYDPATQPQIGPTQWFGSPPFEYPNNKTSLWCYGAPWPDPEATNGGNDYRVVGYAQTFNGTASFGTPGADDYATNMNIKTTTFSFEAQVGSVPIGPTSARVLTACAIFCDPGSEALASPGDEANNWLAPTGAEFNAGTLLSAHLNQSRNPYPYGGNQGHLDGSVSWQAFEKFICRAGPPDGGADFFW